MICPSLMVVPRAEPLITALGVVRDQLASGELPPMARRSVTRLTPRPGIGRGCLRVKVASASSVPTEIVPVLLLSRFLIVRPAISISLLVLAPMSVTSWRLGVEARAMSAQEDLQIGREPPGRQSSRV